MARPTKEVMKADFMAGMSLKEVADKYGIGLSGVESAATNGNWHHERRTMQLKAVEAVSKRQLAQRIKELTDWNNADLALAKAIRSQVADLLTTAQREKKKAEADVTVTKRLTRSKSGLAPGQISAKDLAILASIVETTQRIGRTALGAKDGGSLDDNDDLEDQIASVTVLVKSGRIRPDPD